MKNLLITLGLLFALCGLSAAQSNANIGGVNFSSGASAPAACSGPSYFYNTSTKVYSVCGSGGTYVAIGTSGSFATAANPVLTGQISCAVDGVGAPCYSWTTDLTTGVYRAAASQVAVTLAGVQRILFSGSEMKIVGSGADINFNGTSFVGQLASGVVGIGTSAGGKQALVASGNTVRVTSDFATAANTNLQTITGLSWTFPATGTMIFSFHCHGSYSIATGAVAVAFGIQSATAAATNIFATGEMYTAATVATQATLATLASTTATAIVSGTPGSTGVNNTFDLYGTIENPASTANTINIMVSTATSGDVVTVKRGSYCSLQ